MSSLKIYYVLVVVLLFVWSPALYSQVVKDDFKINNDTLGGGNYNPDVEILESGEEIIVWGDYRNGNANIYGQLYDSVGDPTGTNFKVSTYSGSYTEYYPAIASYGDSLLVIWAYLYGQWILSDGSQSGTGFNLNNGTMFYPEVAVGDSGYFVVWYRTHSSNANEIFLKRYNLNGDSVGSRIIINDVGTGDQRYPRITLNDRGYSVVVWQDNRNSSSYPDIYGQLVDPSGDTIGGNFRINDNPGSSIQYQPSCAMDFEGNFVVVWTDYRDGAYGNIYGQRFDSLGNALDSNFLVTDTAESSYQYEPDCAMDSAGNFVVVWHDYRNGNPNIYGQLFDAAGVADSTNFLIEQETVLEYSSSPRVSMNEDNFVVTWYRYTGNSSRIFKRRFANDGTPAGNQIQVNDLEGTASQQEPEVDMNAGGNIVVTWGDYRELQGIYFQRLNVQGDTLGGNIRVANGHNPDVEVSEDSSFVIVYEVSSDIYYQQFRPNGDSIGSPIEISDTNGGDRSIAVVDLDSDNNSVVAWHDSRNGDNDIYAQLVNSAGDTVGSNFRVNDDAGTDQQYWPDVVMNPSGRFLVTWYDGRIGGTSHIYGQMYESDRTPVGGNFRIDSGGTFNQYYPKTGYLPDGNFIVAWQDYRIPNAIYAQIIDSMGTFVDTNFKVSDHRGHEPSVSVDTSGKFVIAWRDYSSGEYDIYAQKYNSDYSPDSTNFKVNNETEGINPNQEAPSVATDGENYIFVWQDAKWEKGWDIAAKVLNWNQGNVEEARQEEKVKILGVSSPILSGKEWLTLSLSSPAKVDFQLINVAGIVVSSKKLDYATPGIKRVEFDVSKLPCGPYFLSFKTEKGRTIKKAVVIK
jgi:hypothetical protein